MIQVNCYRCGDELDEPGGLLVGPPKRMLGLVVVEKMHVCIDCFFTLVRS